MWQSGSSAPHCHHQHHCYPHHHCHHHHLGGYAVTPGLHSCRADSRVDLKPHLDAHPHITQDPIQAAQEGAGQSVLAGVCVQHPLPIHLHLAGA